MVQPLEERTVPAVFTVTDGGDTGLSTQLRQIWAVANNNGESDTINIGVPAITLLGAALPTYTENANLSIVGGGSGVTTITAPGGQRHFNIGSSSGTLISISGMQLTGGSVSGTGGAIAMTSQTVVLSDLLITGNSSSGDGGGIAFTTGRLQISSSTISNNVSNSHGGGIAESSGGTITLTNCVVSGNTSATNGGGIYSVNSATISIDNSTITLNRGNNSTSSSGGGGIYWFGGIGYLTNSIISSNSTQNTGGGLFTTATWTVVNSQFTGNVAGAVGGGLRNTGPSLITNSVFSGNSAGTSGGGLYTTSASTTVAFSQFTGNTASGASTSTTAGGGGWRNAGGQLLNSTLANNFSSALGGGLLSTGATTVSLSTLVGNSAGGSASVGSGGGIFNTSAASVSINNSTIYDNTAAGSSSGGNIARNAGTITLNSSIVAGGKLTGGAVTGFDLFSSAATTASGNNNIVGTKDGSNFTLSGTGNNVGTDATQKDPLLNALADNGGGYTLAGGGHVQTMSLKSGSPAIDAGNNTAGFTTSQRGAGFRRTIGAGTDIGAYEATSLSGTPDATFAPFEVTTSGNGAATITVVYTDDVGVNTGNFDNTDITVTGPNSFSQSANFVSSIGSGNSVTATYTLTAPSGGWGGNNASNNQLNIGVYTITMNAGQVGDGTNNVPTGSLGTFKTNFGLNLAVSSASDATTGFVYNSGALIFRAALAAVTANQAFAPNAVNTITFDTTTMGSSTVTLVAVSPAAIAVGAATSATAQIGSSLGLVISGPSAANHVTINGSSATNHLVIADGYNVTISNVNFSGFSAASVTGSVISFGNDNVNISNSNFTNNTTTGTGGAINMAGSVATLNSTLFNPNTATGVTMASPQFRNSNTMSITNAVFTNNSASTGGGAIQASGTFSTITIDSSTFTTNTGSVGGAVRQTVATQQMTISNSVFTGNTSTGTAGAVYTQGISAFSKDVFSSNSSASNGGAIRFLSAGFTVASSVFTGNKSNLTSGSSGGGAIYSSSGSSALIANSTFSSNTAGAATVGVSGGALFFSGLVVGGTGSFVIRQSTFSSNTATGATTSSIGGGAIRWNSSGNLTLQNSTIADNVVSNSTVGTGGGVSRTAGSINSESNIISGNSVAGAAGNGPDVFGAASMTVNNTAIGTGSVGFGYTIAAGSGNQTGSAVVLGALANNGGFTLPDGSTIQTCLPGPGSPVRNAGSNPAFPALTLDQRGTGFIRVIGTIDMGAIESDDPTPGAKATAPNITSNAQANDTITVVYSTTYVGGINTSTLDSNDIYVTGNGYAGNQTVTFTGFTGSGNSVTATYTVAAPAGGWGGWNIGSYAINMNAGQVKNNAPDNSSVPAIGLGSFATAFASNLVVDEPSDVDDSDVSVGKRSFREALRLANGNIGTDTITFSSTTFNAPTTITIANAAMSITDSVVITGPAQALTFDANNTNKQFAVSAASVDISKLSFTKFAASASGSVMAFSANNATVSLTNVNFTSNSAAGAGGAVNVSGTSASVTMSSVSFTSNTSSSTGGGALAVTGNTSTVTLNSATFTTNTATSGPGGAILVSGSSVTLNMNLSSAVSNRATAGNGGAISLAVSDSLTLDSVTLDSNKASSNGGAITTSSSSVSLTAKNSTISGNSATSGGGGVYMTGAGFQILFSNSTLSGNTSSGGVGGFFKGYSFSATSFAIHNTTITKNSASSGGGAIRITSGALDIQSSIISGNAGSTSPNFLYVTTLNVLNSVLSSTDGVTYNNLGGNLAVGTDPMLDVLANNGGPTKTHALKSGSPAIDVGSNPDGLSFDQRGSGFARIKGGVPDMGAFESNPAPSASGTAANVTGTGATTYDVTVTFKDGGTGINVSTIDVNDVKVTSAFGNVTFTATTVTIDSSNPNIVIATYTFNAPDNSVLGTWDPSDTDLYSVNLVGTVSNNDPTPLSISTGKLTSFAALLGAKAIVVDNSGDTDDGNYSSTNLTLREAINFSNSNVGNVDTITFNFAAPTTITISGAFTLSDSVTITGPGADKLTVDANKSGRHFTINATQDVAISGMTLTGGSAADGGAIQWTNNDNVTVNGVWFKGNTTSTSGGAIGMTGATTVTGNVDIKNSTFSGNSASTYGGGIYFRRGMTLTISNSTFSSNTASLGGAVGGGSTSAGNITIKNSTISGNSASSAGGGIRVTNASYSVGLVNLESSIVAGNNSATNPDINGFSTGAWLNAATSIIGKMTAGSVIDLNPPSTNPAGVNFVGDATTAVDPSLDPLANYGGPMPTMRLKANSIAIDTGSNPDGLTLDQRGTGFARTNNNITDIGAYETPIPPTPQAKLLSAPIITSNAQTDETIQIVYTDDIGINTSSLDSNDVTITGSGYGAGQKATFTGFTGSGTSVTATYTITAPAGGWGGWQVGAYTVTVNGSQVSDVDTPTPNSVATKALGTFNTAISVTLQVDEQSDVDDGDYSVGKRSFREALKLTNGNLVADSITFDSTKFNGTPIVLGSVMNITDPVAITGPGAAKAIFDGNNAIQIFNINLPSAGTASLSDMTLQKGKAANGGAIQMTDDSVTLTHVTITGSSATTNGGAIALTTGSLVLNSSTLKNNTAAAAGGAVAASSTATVDVKNSTFESNTASSANGGGIFISAGTLTIDPSIFKNNRGLNGGAIAGGTGTNISIDQTYITGNVGTGTNGAVLLLGSGSLTITNSTLSANTAAANGGAITFVTAVATITNTTVANNRSTTGAGISMTGAGNLTINNSTIVGNVGTAGVGGILISSASGVLNISSTIVAANSGTTTPDIDTPASFSVAGTDNLVGLKGANWSFASAPNQFNTLSPLDPGLSPLADNGGALLPDGSHVPTMSLKVGSPALDNGNNNVSLSFDERGAGFNRTNGSGTDVGAFEASASPIPTVSGKGDDVTVSGGTTFDVTVTFKDDIGIDISTVDVNDVVIKTAFGGTTLNAVTFVATPNTGTSTPVQVIYTFNAPNNGVSGQWDPTDTDFYQIWYVGPTVQDGDGNKVVAPSQLSTFSAILGGKSMNVTNAGDTDDGNYTVGNLTLREAMNFSNTNTGNIDTITFSLPSGTTITLTSGFSVADSVVISGPGASKVAVDANKTGRLFDVAGINTLDISGLTLKGGSVTSDGGAIRFGATTVTVTDCVVTGNTATSDGGAFYMTSNAAVLTIVDSEVSNNSAGSTGGAFSNFHAVGAPTVTINNSLFTGNQSTSDGGGLYFFDDGDLTVSNSTFSGNTAGGTGGAMYLFEASGSIYRVNNSTVTGNSAGSTGGGIFFGSAPANVQMNNTIVAGNKGSSAAGNDFSTATPVTGDFNVVGDANGSGFTGTGNLLGTTVSPIDPLLAPLQNNGGKTRTHALQTGSPALNINGATTLTFDQRGPGFPRVVDGVLDAGAFEGVSRIPNATFGAHPNVTSSGASTYSFVVIYTDETGIDTTTINTADVSITGAGSFTSPTVSISGSGTSVTATYTFTAPGGSFDAGDNGTYTISLNGSQVFDLDTPTPNSVPGQTLGTFAVGIGANFVVNAKNDESTDTDGKVSLREAILANNATPGIAQNTITFDSIVFNSASTITLALGELAITKPVIVQGLGAKQITVDANNASRIFNISDSSSNIMNVTISGLTLTGGSFTGSGGAITDAENLTLDGVWLKNNHATNAGGGVFIGTSSVSFNLLNSAVTGNIADGSFAGSGVYMTGSAFNILIENSTISGNTTTNAGAYGAFCGFAFSANSFKIKNSTITANNSGTGGGGGVRITSGTIEIESSIIQGNTTTNSDPNNTDFRFATTIISKTSALGSIPTGTTFTDNGGNLTIGSDPLLSALADNGGQTPTHALKAGSPALNTGSNPDSLSFDQRGAGFNRSVGVTDMGAFEVQPVVPAATVLSVVLDEGTGNTNINGVNGTVQRSEVRRIIVTFSSPVTFTGANAFSLARSASSLSSPAGGAGPVSLTTNPVSGSTSVVTITFNAGTFVDSTFSLQDGLYNFVIDASKVSNAGGQLNGGAGAGSNYTVNGTTANKFYRFYGDENGDGSVDQTDYLVFRNAISGGPNSVFDFNGDGDVDQNDYLRFRQNISSAP
ncbi:MAG: choice-of-anchor Q domain-containing protein [Gemmataceae bacterium]